MRKLLVALVLLACSAALLAAAPAALAGEPPDQDDPCSTNGRNSCGTTGVGSYETYRYGIRWFGDYRGAVEGVARTFCIDLQYWYPSPKYRYAENTSGKLKNRDGEAVPLERLRRMAYALWNAGQTNDRVQQAATMLYVHSLMGDARPGEVAAGSIGREVEAAYRAMDADATRFHGPYRIDARVPDRLSAGQEGTLTVRVLAASGVAVPNVTLTLVAKGASGVPRQVTTDAGGVATVTFTAQDADGVDITATTGKLASNLPRIFDPTEPAAAINGQRLAAAASQVVSTTAAVSVRKSKLEVRTKATADTLLVGQSLRDKVFVTGAAESWRGTVKVEIHGPFRSQAQIRCDGEPAWTGTFRADGPGEYVTPYATMRKVGWYTYREIVPGDAAHVGVTTECRDPEEIFRVDTQPTVTTVVSSDRILPGAELSDTVRVTGTGGEALTVRADLFGPFASRDAITCDGQPIWTGNIRVTRDGEYETAPVPLTVPGYYHYRESITATGFVRGVETQCGEEAETAIVAGQPKILTRVSAAVVSPGSELSDTAIVTGLGALSATVQVELFGPYASKGEIDCAGTPYWKGTFVAKGDGTYETPKVKVDRVGYYTYRESITEAPPYDAVTTRCGESAETSLVTSQPIVETLVSNEVVAPGARITDLVKVSGLGQTDAKIEVRLYGPFATRDAIRCTGTPHWQGVLFVPGDGQYRTEPVKIGKAGFYTYRETLVGSPRVKEYVTECAEVSETGLARPLILTGRNEATRRAVAQADAGPRTPVKVVVSGLSISAPVVKAAIDLDAGALAVPTDIRKTAWWVDGAAPGSKTGSILIAGHVDSARAGAGAFFRLREARPGDRVQVVTRDGSTATYRVVSVKKMLKAALPTDIFSLQGGSRLVLVTCGGPFLEATGHYRDNVVVTAVPA